MKDIIIHDMASTAADKHFAYLDRNNQLKIIVENRPFEEVTSPTLRRFMPRFVFVDPAIYPGITTDQNANAWVDGVEWADIIVDSDELSGNLPEVLVKLALAARMAALVNPLA